MTEHTATTGPRLKAERERRGLSSQKAADELHLDGWIIDALEAEDYQRIGPSVYAKGHLKRYADLLGLPPAEIMAGYDSRAQAPRAPAPQPVTVRVRTDEPAAGALPWPQIAGGAIAVLLAVGLFWWKPWHRHAAPSAAPTAALPSGASAGSATDADTAAGAGSGSPAAPPAAANTRLRWKRADARENFQLPPGSVPRSQISFGNALAEAILLPIFGTKKDQVSAK